MAVDAEMARVVSVNRELMEKIEGLESWSSALKMVQRHQEEMNYVTVCRCVAVVCRNRCRGIRLPSKLPLTQVVCPAPTHCIL